MPDGICTLANDFVFDQVVALINSIEVHAGKACPICIYPYDHRVERLQAFVETRPQVTIFDDSGIIERWDQWVSQLWATHPTAAERWQVVNGKPGIHRMGTHRRLCAFDGSLERFIYMDADTLLLRSPDLIFQALDQVDWVTYDFQYKDLSHVFDVNSARLTQQFSQDQLKHQVFCSGFYGTKQGIVGEEDIKFYLEKLSQGEAEILYPMAPDQTILNYFVLRKPIKSINLALTLPTSQRTGNSVTSQHFEERNAQVFDKGVPLLYLHYIGISSKIFARLCQGENLDIPYRETFLYYRYLHAPETRPQLIGSPINPYPTTPGLAQRMLRKLGLSK